MRNQNYYTTADFWTATYIYSQGHTLLEISWLSDSKAEFIFEDSARVKDDISRFWSGEAKVNAKKLLQAQRELKQRMYGSKR